MFSGDRYFLRLLSNVVYLICVVDNLKDPALFMLKCKCITLFEDFKIVGRSTPHFH